MQSPQIIALARQVAAIIDSFYTSGTSNQLKKEPVLFCLLDWLKLLEEVLFKLALLAKEHPELTSARQTVVQESYRPLLERWNNFLFALSESTNSFRLIKPLGLWRSFLLFRLSDKSWAGEELASLSLSPGLIAARLGFFNTLWQQEPHKIWQATSPLFISLEDGSSYLASALRLESIAPVESDSPQDNRLLNPLKKLIAAGQPIASSTRWQSFWQKSSGGIYSQFAVFQLDSVSPLKLTPKRNYTKQEFSKLIGSHRQATVMSQKH